MVEFLDETNQLESNTIGVFRSAATMAGGRRFSFGSLVVVGDKNGRIGLGYGKANEVPPAIEKAQKDAKKNLKQVTLQGGTIPHEVQGRYGASSVKLIPASPGSRQVAHAVAERVVGAHDGPSPARRDGLVAIEGEDGEVRANLQEYSGTVSYEWYTEEGSRCEERFTGITSRILQHEVDHLNGITFMKRAASYHLQKARKDRKIKGRRRKRTQ